MAQQLDKISDASALIGAMVTRSRAAQSVAYIGSRNQLSEFSSCVCRFLPYDFNLRSLY